MAIKFYGSAQTPLLTFTNTENVTIDKGLFIRRLSEEGVTNFNGTINLTKLTLPSQIRQCHINISGTLQQITIVGETPVAQSVALGKLAEYGIYTTLTYLNGLANGYHTLTTFTSTIGDGTRLILDLYGGVNSQAQIVSKLYGSMNGKARLIHQGYKHLTYN